jgi:Outer membrane protein beta-barrel domain
MKHKLRVKRPVPVFVVNSALIIYIAFFYPYSRTEEPPHFKNYPAMNGMLKTVAVLLFFLFTLPVVKAQVHWAVKGGGQVSYASIRKDNNRTATTAVPGLNAGLAAKVYFEKGLAFASGIQYSLRGYKTKPAVTTDPAKTYTFHYAELPLMLEVDFASEDNGPYLKIGPYMSLVITGKEKYKDATGKTIMRTPKIDFSGQEFNRFDGGFQAFFGYQFNKQFYAEGGFQLGGNMSNNENGPTIRQRVASVSVGYYFK